MSPPTHPVFESPPKRSSSPVDPCPEPAVPRWRLVLLGIVGLATLLAVVLMPPMPQPQDYYRFADDRTILGIPNFFDVLSNLPFLLVGVPGLILVWQGRCAGMKEAWTAMFLGLVSVSLGSAYFHWDPRDETLGWDRASLAFGFIGFTVAVLGEQVNLRLARLLLVPGLLAAVVSVVYWRMTDDLRAYLWIQFAPLLVIPLVLLLFRNPFSHGGLVAFALAGYVAAKAAEIWDREIFDLTGQRFSGHSLKHLLAAAACFALYWMLRVRRPRAAGRP